MAFLIGFILGTFAGLAIAGLCNSASKPEPPYFGGD